MARTKTYYPGINRRAYDLQRFIDEYKKRCVKRTGMSGADLTTLDDLEAALLAFTTQHDEYVEIR